MELGDCCADLVRADGSDCLLFEFLVLGEGQFCEPDRPVICEMMERVPADLHVVTGESLEESLIGDWFLLAIGDEF